MFKTVTMYTNKLQELRGFYGNVLELNVTAADDHYFQVEIGESTLIFQESEHASLYHFAINIPGNQYTLAKLWAKERVVLNREDGLDDIYYSRFDADAFYFEDPAGNVIEFIARRHVDKWSDFSIESLLNISEVSITTPFVKQVGEQLQNLGIAVSGHVRIEPEELNFIGRKDTFILLVPPQRRWYFSRKMSVTSPIDIHFTNGKRVAINEKGELSEDESG
ncbi:glyoxalase [Psychrobacillus sp. FSL W7-1493]|uniref:glyoxalase n=1 Tax=Psychrobacillus sp. FSL W7-1493 TaxID=2921552 RepID=UPI0030F66DC0